MLEAGKTDSREPNKSLGTANYPDWPPTPAVEAFIKSSIEARYPGHKFVEPHRTSLPKRSSGRHGSFTLTDIGSYLFIIGSLARKHIPRALLANI